MLTMSYECTVTMTSGGELGPLKCDETTTIGDFRKTVLKILKGMRNKGKLKKFNSFLLVRGEQILRNDSILLWEILPTFKSKDCVFTCVLQLSSCDDE